MAPGSSLVWETFRSVRGNNRGDYVISGNASGDTLTDDVLVFNGQRIVARESDPVDMDGNGAFDGPPVSTNRFAPSLWYPVTEIVSLLLTIWKSASEFPFPLPPLQWNEPPLTNPDFRHAELAACEYDVHSQSTNWMFFD